MKTFTHIITPIGLLTLAEQQEHICNIGFGKLHINNAEFSDCSALLKEASAQLQAYFEKRLQSFDLPLHLVGTPYQQQVWKALQEIPYGATCSYADIAHCIGNPKSVRAVGMANHRNPIAIVVPCHRVIGKNAKLTGYGGGLEAKSFLLDLEKTNLFGPLTYPII